MSRQNRCAHYFGIVRPRCLPRWTLPIVPAGRRPTMSRTGTMENPSCAMNEA